MIANFIKKLVGTRNDRQLKRMGRTVTTINALETEILALADEELTARTPALRERYAAGEDLDALLPEAFAVVREAAKRTLDMRHFDVQLIGGMVLHEGRIAEMRTGEGKTLVATLAAYLNALAGSVHVVTVNDYLAHRDAAWMGEIFKFLGMRTGVVVAGMSPEDKREAYAADIVYGTNNEFGFDYLRDNMAFTRDEKMQADLGFAIVDEVDSILIDEARTPLIISGPTDDNSELYTQVDRLIPTLEKQQEEEGPGDYSVDEKSRQVHLTEAGHDHIERLLEEAGLLAASESLYGAANIGLMHHVYASLRAHALFQRDVDYMVKDGQVVIVDEFTGRTMPGRRWSEGLHQAVEAKEGVAIQNENQTLASITFQNYFRLYGRLSGMTGTADTEAAEFQQIYGLEVVIIPTHREMVREDSSDLVYLSKAEKFAAVSEDIKDCQQRGQPVLVGTASIETSEYLSGLLKKQQIEHQVLNAKHHASEADIIAQAGQSGTVTIATNMAGRGTDIVLGGNLKMELEALGEDADESRIAAIKADWQQRHDAVLASGGLHIVGSERHESRRIDNQLRGRAGRQGDAGSSRFYLSLEDDLMRIFASERMAAIMQKLGMEEGEAIEHPWVTKAIENAQRKVEGRNFDIRKQLLEYDDVANDQRREIYALRNELMATDDVSENLATMREEVASGVVDGFIPPQSLEEQWDVPGLETALEQEFGQKYDISGWLAADDSLHQESLHQRIFDSLNEAYGKKVEAAGTELMHEIEKAVMLQVLDTTWKEHLAAMDYLRQGIHLRGYAQKNPKQEFKREAFEMFQGLVERFNSEVVGVLFKGQVWAEEDVAAVEAQRRQSAPMEFQHESMSMDDGEAVDAEAEGAHTPFVREGRKVGRNEPCPCGSGKKYKRCHGRLS